MKDYLTLVWLGILEVFQEFRNDPLMCGIYYDIDIVLWILSGFEVEEDL